MAQGAHTGAPVVAAALVAGRAVVLAGATHAHARQPLLFTTQVGVSSLRKHWQEVTGAQVGPAEVTRTVEGAAVDARAVLWTAPQLHCEGQPRASVDQVISAPASHSHEGSGPQRAVVGAGDVARAVVGAAVVARAVVEAGALGVVAAAVVGAAPAVVAARAVVWDAAAVLAGALVVGALVVPSAPTAWHTHEGQPWLSYTVSATEPTLQRHAVGTGQPPRAVVVAGAAVVAARVVVGAAVVAGAPVVVAARVVVGAAAVVVAARVVVGAAVVPSEDWQKHV